MGNNGSETIKDIERFLNKSGVRIISKIPSDNYKNTKIAPKASLNIAKRLRWAKEMEAKFNTPYIHVNNRNRFSGLLGAENFYLDIYNALNSDNRILEVLEIEKQKAIEETKAKLEEISKYKVCLYSSSLGMLPAQIKKYKEEYKLDIPYIVLEITDVDIENMNVDKETIDKLYKRIYESISTYTKDSIFLINSTQDKIEKLKEKVDALIGLTNPSLETWGIPVIASNTADKGKKVAVLGCAPKADSTRCIVNRKIPTVLDQLKNKVESDISFKGYKDIICIESGGPESGSGCAGRGVMTAIEQIERRNILEGVDIVIYDVLGDVVCGGFSMPLRRNIADEVYIVTTSDYMSLYTANNICRGIKKYVESGDVRLAGIIHSGRSMIDNDDLVKEIANILNTKVVAKNTK